MTVTESTVREALSAVRFPGMTRDIVSFGFVKAVEVEDGAVSLRLVVPTQNPGAGSKIREEVERAVSAIEGVDSVDVALEVKSSGSSASQKAVARDAKLIPEVDRVIAVASGKGGVGKSTIASNLAVSLATAGHRVGILDADIYGPSLPLMFGISERPRILDGRLQPFAKFGVKVMSLGFVLDVDTPVIWRGPMVMKALEQLLGDVDWGALDYLVVDLPPGTGDAQLTLAQKIPIAGAVIVSTPQDVALIDARKGLAMFHKVNVPVMGIVENMSTFVCPHCGEATDIFKTDGAKRTAELLEANFLGSIPLDAEIVLGGDSGTPIVAREPEGAHAERFAQLATRVHEEAEKISRSTPSLSIL